VSNESLLYIKNFYIYEDNIKLLKQQVKDLLMQLECICNQVKDKNEVAIIEEYNYKARCHTIMLTSKTIFSDLCLQLLFNCELQRL